MTPFFRVYHWSAVSQARTGDQLADAPGSDLLKQIVAADSVVQLAPGSAFRHPEAAELSSTNKGAVKLALTKQCYARHTSEAIDY
jgi:hypothetical protein